MSETIGDRIEDILFGDRVLDKAAIDGPDSPSLAIVYEVEDTPAGDYDLGGKPLMEYEGNTEYGHFDDRVVHVLFTDYLDANCGEWSDYANDLVALEAYLIEQRDMWSIPLDTNTYAYPESRLHIAWQPGLDGCGGADQ